MAAQNYPIYRQGHYIVALDAVNGACHRYPQLFAGDSSPREMHHGGFPPVSRHVWCGEFLPRRNDYIPAGGGVN
jgi:hypothetical protein